MCRDHTESGWHPTAQLSVALAALALLSSLSPALNARESAPADPARQITGRVVDEGGQPVAGASVRTAVPGPFADPPSETRTDVEGRFALDVPFPRLRYALEILGPGHHSCRSSGVSGGEPILATLKPRKSASTHDLTGTVRNGATGAPVAGARVVFPPHEAPGREIRTDTAGRFRIPGVSDDVSQAVVFARSDSLVSPYRMLFRKDRDVTLSLAPPGVLEGATVDLRGDPVPGCTVTVSAGFGSRFAVETEVDESGRFRFADLPPGDYRIAVRHPTYCELTRAGGLLDYTRISVTSGKTAVHRIAMRRMETIAGRVLSWRGEPLEGVRVAVKATWGMIRRATWRSCATDRDGRFTLASARRGQSVAVTAKSPEHGCGETSVTVHETEDGTPTEAVIRLGGYADIRGIVRDEDGTPLGGVRVMRDYNSGTTTNAAGRFQFGHMSLPAPPPDWVPGAGEEPPVHEFQWTVVAPRPDRGGLRSWPADGSRRPARAPAPDVRFYRHRQVTVRTCPGETNDLDIVLTPAELLTFSGRVLSHDGTPVAGAAVVLFAGNPNPEKWHRVLHQDDLIHGNSVAVGSQSHQALALGVSKDEGSGPCGR